MATASVSVLTRIPRLSYYLMRLMPDINFQEIGTEGNHIDFSKLDTEVIIADLDLLGPHIYDLNKVKWVQATWAGVERLLPYIKKNKKEPSFPISRFTGEAMGRIISEYVVSHLVAHERDFLRTFQNSAELKWDRTGTIVDYRTISDMTITILGVGNIGQCIAQALKLFGAKVWGLIRSIPSNKIKFLDECRTREGLQELLSGSDCIVNTLPDTSETKGLLNMDILGKAKPGLIFINVGRGTVIDPTDIIKAIEAGYISKAILDVFTIEPLPLDSPLWTTPEVLITPHVAGISRPQDIAELFASNYEKYKSGLPIPNIVRFSQEY